MKLLCFAAIALPVFGKTVANQVRVQIRGESGDSTIIEFPTKADMEAAARSGDLDTTKVISYEDDGEWGASMPQWTRAVVERLTSQASDPPTHVLHPSRSDERDHK